MACSLSVSPLISRQILKIKTAIAFISFLPSLEPGKDTIIFIKLVSVFLWFFSDRRVLIFPKAPDLPIFSWHFDVPSIIYGLQQVLRMITSHS